MLNNRKTTVKAKSATLSAAVVKSPEEKAQGLMNVSSLSTNEGMLFCYLQEENLSFWMKSTNIPLSIAFINKNKEITQIEELKPNDETKINSKKPSKWALETNKGWFENNDISVGDKLDFNSEPVRIKIIKERRNKEHATK